MNKATKSQALRGIPTSPAPPTPTFTPAPTFAISGVVWNDGNGNGLREVNEGALPNVGVELRQGSCGGPALSSLTTGANGAYSFSGLAARSYCVRVNSPPQGGWTATTPTEAVISVDLNAQDVQVITSQHVGARSSDLIAAITSLPKRSW